MASKKTPTKKSNNKSKKNTVASRQNADINRVTGVLLFSLSLLFFFIAVIKGQGAWLFVHNVYVGLFGMFAACVFPLLTMVITVLYSLKEQDTKLLLAKGAESVVMVLLISSCIHIFQNQPGDVFSQCVTESYNSASESFNGGLFGAVIGWLLLTLGKAPAVIVNILLIFVDFMFLSGITIIQFLKGAAKPAKATYDKVQPVIEEKIEQRKRSKASIDVPLDEVAPGEEKPDKKQKSKKKSDETPQLQEAVETQKIIDEINAANAKNKAERESKKAKTIDENVEKASEESSDNDADKEKFEVT